MMTGKITPLTLPALMKGKNRQQRSGGLDLLPLKYKEVLIMMYFQDLSTKEIAEVLKIPETSVRTRLRRAKKKLIPFLQKEVKNHE